MSKEDNYKTLVHAIHAYHEGKVISMHDFEKTDDGPALNINFICLDELVAAQPIVTLTKSSSEKVMVLGALVNSIIDKAIDVTKESRERISDKVTVGDYVMFVEVIKKSFKDIFGLEVAVMPENSKFDKFSIVSHTLRLNIVIHEFFKLGEMFNQHVEKETIGD